MPSSNEYKDKFMRLSEKIEKHKHYLEYLMRKRKFVLKKLFREYRKEQEYGFINTNK